MGDSAYGKYALLYAGADDIPELVVDYCGYGMNLYTYEKGRGHCLMNHWGYGAMGNFGYSYCPRKGIYYNQNADMAGAILKESYLSKRGKGQLKVDYWVKTTNFKDIDDIGGPSAGDLFGDEAGGVEYYNNTGKEMTEAEIKAVVDLYKTYEMVELCGVMDYDTLLRKLGK